MAFRLSPQAEADLFGPDVRSFPVAGCVVYYRAADVVLIARVLHGRRHHAAAWEGEE
ncbi:MAG: hypothetical protein ABIT71_08425 [Vicinamibacteraceae bacterium]